MFFAFLQIVNLFFLQYAENFCWAQDTYFIPPKVFVEDISAEERRERRISYYQWMPFFLLFQAACFKAPTLIWKYFAGQSGIDEDHQVFYVCHFLL